MLLEQLCPTHRHGKQLLQQEDKNMGLFNKKNKDTASSSSGNSQLKISVSKDGAQYTFLLGGRLDTMTSPGLDSKIKEVIDDAKTLIFNFSDLEYISSAGLRVLLGTYQVMENKGEMIIRNLTAPVREVFELTGFARLFNIE